MGGKGTKFWRKRWCAVLLSLKPVVYVFLTHFLKIFYFQWQFLENSAPAYGWYSRVGYIGTHIYVDYCIVVPFDAVQVFVEHAWASYCFIIERNVNIRSFIRWHFFASNVFFWADIIWAPMSQTHSGCLDSNFFPLLTRPQGFQGCQKITIELKLHRLQKTVEIEKKMPQMPVFWRFFEFSSN